MRLACQLRPTGDIKVTPLLPPFATARDGFARPGYLQGGELEIAILFADLRAFTRLAETRLPYDVVFVLNRYFAAMGRAVEEAGGHLDKFIGDGVMALFGIGSDPATGCREALHAARLMSEHLVELNAALENDLGEPLRIGIGLHFGPTIVGEMGYSKAVSLTAVGDAVNTASRLESLGGPSHARRDRPRGVSAPRDRDTRSSANARHQDPELGTRLARVRSGKGDRAGMNVGSAGFQPACLVPGWRQLLVISSATLRPRP